MVAQRILVRPAGARARIIAAPLHIWRRIVLDDEVFPVRKPHRPVRANLRKDR